MQVRDATLEEFHAAGRDRQGRWSVLVDEFLASGKDALVHEVGDRTEAQKFYRSVRASIVYITQSGRVPTYAVKLAGTEVWLSRVTP